MSSLLHMLLLICCLFHSGVSQNSKITCPRPFYKEGSSALNLTIDSSTFSGCDIGPASVTCRWYPKTGTESVICIQSVTSCDQTLTNRGCRCNSVSGQVYDYSLSFSMLPDEESGNISCSLDCIVSPGNPGPKATVESDQTCLNIDLVSKCKRNGPCKHGTCKIDQNDETFCDCTGTEYDGDHCEDLSKALVKSIAIGCAAVAVAVVIIVLLIVVIFRLLWKTLFSCVICVIVCVDNEKKKTLHDESTKRKVEDFVSEHFTMHCCCCCCCSWLGWCCLGKLMLRGPKGNGNDGGVEGGILASCEDCSMGCVWCLSFVKNVKVDVHDIEDNQVSVLITLTSPLSWYSEAEDMPEKVKEYIRTKILKEPVKELRHTSKPSMHLGVGCIAGSPDRRNEPPADYPAGAPKAQTKYTGNGNGQPKKRKSDKEIPLSIVGRSSPPSETSGDEKTHMIPPTKERTLPVPPNQHEPTSTGLGKSASPRLNPLTQDHSKMTSVERNSGAFPRKLPSPGQLPLDPIPSGKKS